MDKVQGESQSLFDEVKNLMKQKKIIELRELIEEYHTMDIFDVIQALNEDEQVRFFEILPIDVAASILEEGEVEFFSNILLKIDTDHAKNVLEQMSLGDLANMLKELDENDRHKIIKLLNKEDSNAVKELLFYEEETSGSTMTKGYIAVNKKMNTAQAIKLIRKEATEADSIYYVYVVDDENKLVGVLSLRDLFLSRDTTIIQDIMVENIISVNDKEDREEAVRLVSKYNLVAIPVVNDENKLKGIIIIDDIIDVMEEEATEDMYKFAGSSEHERDVAEKENATFLEQLISSIRGRITWLIITAIFGILASYMFIKLGVLANTEYGMLIFFTPLIISMGGGIGTQTSAMTVISLNNNDMKKMTIIKEILSGVINGVISAIVVAIILFLLTGHTVIFMIVAIATLINMILGATLGVLIPVFFDKNESDPSTISAPVITSLMDIIGIMVYYLIILIIIL